MNWLSPRARRLGGLVGVSGALVLLAATPLRGAIMDAVPTTEPERLVLVIAVLGGLGTYMVKTIYMLVGQRRGTMPDSDRREQAHFDQAAWQVLTQHMEREERASEGLTRLITENIADTREFALRQRMMADTLDKLAEAQQRITESLILLRNPASGGNIL